MHESTPKPSLLARFLSLRFGFLPQRFRALSPLLIVIGVGIAGLLVMGRSGTKSVVEAGNGIKRVQILSVRPAPVAGARQFTGTLRARIETDMAFRVGGKIAERRVQAGERVKAGTVLALLDATDFRLNREAAEAELHAAATSARQQELDFARVSELKTRGYATAQAEEAKRTTLEEARGRLERAKRQVELATNNEAYTRLTADADGIVAGINVEAGQVVAAGQPVARIARDGEREALVAVPEQDLAFVRTAKANATLWSEPGMAHGARLRELSPNADVGTRTFQARFAIEGLPADAPLGMSLTLALADPAAPTGIRVPLSALLNEGGGPEVFVVGADNVLVRRPVKLVGYDAREALIASGLDVGERIVTLGVHTVRAGEKVLPLPETARGS